MQNSVIRLKSNIFNFFALSNFWAGYATALATFTNPNTYKVTNNISIIYRVNVRQINWNPFELHYST